MNTMLLFPGVFFKQFTFFYVSRTRVLYDCSRTSVPHAYFRLYAWLGVCVLNYRNVSKWKPSPSRRSEKPNSNEFTGGMSCTVVVAGRTSWTRQILNFYEFDSSTGPVQWTGIFSSSLRRPLDFGPAKSYRQIQNPASLFPFLASLLMFSIFLAQSPRLNLGVP